jgi:hypothetical protein
VAIDSAISAVDKADLPGEARLLVAPTWQLTALWVVDDNGQRTFVIAQAARDKASHLNVFEAGEFINWVHRLPIIKGLAF